MSSLVSHVVNLCVSHHDLLRNTAVQILYSMVVSQYQEHRHFDDIEHELISKLDSLFMSDSKADDLSRAFFITQLRHLFEASNVEEQLRAKVSNFLDSVDLFLEMLLSVRALPEGEEFSDDRVIATVRYIPILSRLGHPHPLPASPHEFHSPYRPRRDLHQICTSTRQCGCHPSPPRRLYFSSICRQMHLQSQNYVEAALTLKLHADLYEWNLNSFVEPMEDLLLPQQSQFHRKETLHLLILDYFGKGKAWESAIEICKELAYQHSEVTFD